MADPIAPAPSISPLNRAVRNVVVGRTPAARHAADTASTVLLVAGAGEPVLVDVLEKGVTDGDGRGALGSAIIDGSTQLISEGFNLGLKYALSGTRDGIRPLADACKKDPSYDSYCGTNNVTLGDPSGHSNTAGTVFGLNIAHALWDKTYRNADGSLKNETKLKLTLSGTALAAMEFLRMRADKHTFEQTVLTGGPIGTLFGVGIPFIAKLSGVGYDRYNAGDVLKPTVLPYVAPNSSGVTIGITGTF